MELLLKVFYKSEFKPVSCFPLFLCAPMPFRQKETHLTLEFPNMWYPGLVSALHFSGVLHSPLPLFAIDTSAYLISINVVRHNCSESIFCLLLTGESETRMAPGRRNETEVLPICVEAEELAVPRPLESKVQCLWEALTLALYLVSSPPLPAHVCVQGLGSQGRMGDAFVNW